MNSVSYTDDELKRKEQRVDIIVQLNTAQANKDDYERHVQNAENAKLTIELAKGGLEFMNGSQKDDTADKVEAGIYPEQGLLDSLGLIYDGSLGDSYISIVSQAASNIDAMIVNLKDKLYLYENEVKSLSNLLAYL